MDSTEEKVKRPAEMGEYQQRLKTEDVRLQQSQGPRYVVGRHFVCWLLGFIGVAEFILGCVMAAKMESWMPAVAGLIAGLLLISAAIVVDWLADILTELRRIRFLLSKRDSHPEDKAQTSRDSLGRTPGMGQTAPHQE